METQGQFVPRNEGGDAEEERYSHGYPSPSSYEDGEEEENRPRELYSRYAETTAPSVEDRETLDEVETTVDRGGPSYAEVQSLGPIEEFEDDMFDKVERAVPAGSGTVKQVLVCKFCGTEFAYNLRDIHGHKQVCSKYPGSHDVIRETITVTAEDNPEQLVDVEVERVVGAEEGDEEEVEVKGPDAPIVEGDENEVANERAREEEPDSDEDATQMLENEKSAVLLPDRIEMPGDGDIPRPTLKVVTSRDSIDRTKVVEEASVAYDDDVEMGEVGDTSVEFHEPAANSEGEDEEMAHATDEVANDATPEHLSRDESPGASSTASRDTEWYRIIKEESGERAECLQCGKIMANRPSTKSQHRKKCLVSRLDPSASAEGVQTITPKKKPTKRRMSAQDEFFLDEDTASQPYESENDSHTGSPPLRRSKRNRTEGKAEGKSKETDTTDGPAQTSTLVESTVKRTSSAASASKDDEPLDHFDLLASAKTMQCKHCHNKMKYFWNTAVSHLDKCDAYKSTIDNGSQSKAARALKRGKTAETSRALVVHGGDSLFGRTTFQAMIRHADSLTASEIVEADHDIGFKWICGSDAMADKLQRSFGKNPETARTNAARFKAVERELCGFNVSALLTKTPRPNQICAVVANRLGNATKHRVLPKIPASVALTLYETGSAISIPAPNVVSQMFVPHLVSKMHNEAFVSSEMHHVNVVCGLDPMALDWQYHSTDTIVICLRGKALWKTKSAMVKSPLRDFNLSIIDEASAMTDVKMQAASLEVDKGLTAISPPSSSMFDFSNDSDTNEADDGEQATAAAQAKQWVVEAGSVVYLPVGTWYMMKGLEGDPMWLQIQLQKAKVRDYVADVVRQLLWSDAKWAETLKVSPTGDVNVVQHQVAESVGKLADKLRDLTPREIVPDLLAGSRDVSPITVQSNSNGSTATKVFEVDLTDRDGFKGGTDLQFFKGSMFRVNPLAVILKMSELPTPFKEICGAAVPSSEMLAQPSTTSQKKALSRKNKRAGAGSQGPHVTPTSGSNNGSATTNSAKSSYLLHFGFGTPDLMSRMVVKFHCNATQQSMLDWIRSRETKEAFHVSEVMKVVAHFQGGVDDREQVKMMLRFLCTTGYVASVNVPL